MKFFVHPYTSDHVAVIEASTPFEAALSFSKEYVLSDFNRFVVEGDGVHLFEYAKGLVTEIGNVGTEPSASDSPKGPESNLIRGYCGILSQDRFWKLFLAGTFLVTGCIMLFALVTTLTPFLFGKGGETEPLEGRLLRAILLGGFGGAYLWFSSLLFSAVAKARSGENSGRRESLSAALVGISTLLTWGGILSLLTIILTIAMLVVGPSNDTGR